MKINDKLILFFIATFVCSYGIADTLIKKTYSSDYEDVIVFNSNFIIDEKNDSIGYVTSGTSVKDLYEESVINDSNVLVYDSFWIEKDNSDSLCGGDYIVITQKDKSVKNYKILLIGDINEDGVINVIDLANLVSYINILETSESEVVTNNKYVYDLNQDGEINTLDLVKMRRIIVGND